MASKPCKHPDELIEWDEEGINVEGDAPAYFGTCSCGARICEEYARTGLFVISENGDSEFIRE